MLGIIILLENIIRRKPKTLNRRHHNFLHDLFILLGINLPSISDVMSTPFAEIHAQSIILPAPNFTVGTVYFGEKASPSFLHS